MSSGAHSRSGFSVVTEIDVDSLVIGMQVTEIDRPWIETPFAFQGFEIRSDDEIALLRQLCRRVKVLDEDRRIAQDEARRRARPRTSRLASTTDPVPSGIFRAPRVPTPPPKPVVREEILPARSAHTALVDTVASTMADLRAGRSLDVARIQAATQPLIDSVSRNPDAFAWLTIMKQKNTGIYNQSVAAAVLILTVGRHLGLPRPALDSMALGGLLFDVGKTRIPDDILLKPDRLTDDEFKEFKLHVQYGDEILSETRGLDESAMLMLKTHHERHDGSGYPFGMKGDEIPAFGKIAGIVDAYLTMLHSNTTGKRPSPHRVLNYLNRRRDLEFESALVEEFIQAIGIYPTGTLVELSDGRVGVVLEQNRLRRLRPKVLLLLDANRNSLGSSEVLDLMLESSRGNQIQVVDCLDPDALGIDPDDIFQ
jgi:HD-GYP domain-containing protein (c-di-GMP phosphodiesterase class II)